MAVLRLGSIGPDVLLLQQRLKALGYKVNPDGKFGNETDTAVRAFQKAKGLIDDGIVGSATQGVLMDNSTVTPSPTAGPLTADILIKGLGMTADNVAIWLSPLTAALQEFGITSKAEIAAWLANIAHESGNFTKLVENTNYSAVRLSQVWPGRYAAKGEDGKSIPGSPNALANRLGGNPQAVANNVYANRGGNGDEASGDGYKYRGRGPIGLTFLDNYRACGKALGLDLVNNPEQVENPTVGARTAGWFWKTNNIGKYANAGDFDGVADMINQGHKTAAVGDAIGYADRKAKYDRLTALL